MAIWQFHLNLIPRDVLIEACGEIPSTLSEDLLENLPHWDNSNFKDREAQILKKYLTQKKSWSESIELWGTEESHCVELIYDEGKVAEVSIRLDLRSFDKRLVTLVRELGTLYDAVGINEYSEVFQLEKSNLKAEIEKSKAFRFLKDPRLFLDQLSNKDGN